MGAQLRGEENSFSSLLAPLPFSPPASSLMPSVQHGEEFRHSFNQLVHIKRVLSFCWLGCDGLDPVFSGDKDLDVWIKSETVYVGDTDDKIKRDVYRKSSILADSLWTDISKALDRALESADSKEASQAAVRLSHLLLQKYSLLDKVGAHA